MNQAGELLPASESELVDGSCNPQRSGGTFVLPAQPFFATINRLGGIHLGNPGYNVVSPVAGPDWGIQFQVNLLFPK